MQALQMACQSLLSTLPQHKEEEANIDWLATDISSEISKQRIITTVRLRKPTKTSKLNTVA